MRTSVHFSLLAGIAAYRVDAASPTPAFSPSQVVLHTPRITPSSIQSSPTRTYKHRRDIISDLAGDITSILAGLGSDIPTWVAEGVPNFFQGFPSGSAVQSSLGIASSELAALPTQALNLGPYANWTEGGWNLRLHGNIYKQPNTSESKLNDLANVFLIGTSVEDLPASQASQARNLTSEIFVVQQGNVQPVFMLAPTATNGTQVVQSLTAPYNTTAEGDYDAFSILSSAGLTAGNATTQIQTLDVQVVGTTLGNATAYLVPPTGLTIVSDIDDILRVTKIYDPAEGLLNSFARPFVPWMTMPSIYANWSASITEPEVHFHYLTTTPEQVTRNYESFIYATYPAGSFDTRPLNFSNVAETLTVRKYLLDKVFATFPQRRFLLIADTSNSDVMKDYPALAHQFPDRVCILLRNTSATDSSDKFPYDTSGFKGLNQSSYMFFRTPDDLLNLDIENGACYNSSVPQNVTFGYQGLPFGLGSSGVASSASSAASSAVSSVSGQASSVLASASAAVSSATSAAQSGKGGADGLLVAAMLGLAAVWCGS